MTHSGVFSRGSWAASRYGVMVGLLGTTALGIGSFNPDFAHNPIGWQFRPADAVASTLSDAGAGLLLFIGTLLLISGWWMIRPRAGHLANDSTRILALWSLPLLAVPAVGTGDVFAYADSGWAFLHGQSTYEVGLGGAGGPFALGVDPIWSGDSVPWPPLSIVAYSVVIRLMAFHPYWAVMGQRLLALVGVALIAVLLPRVGAKVGAPDPWVRWFGVLNPLVVVHFVGGAHIDALATGMAIAALWIVLRATASRWVAFVAAAVVVGLSMGFKQYTGLVVVAVAGLPVQALLSEAPPIGRLWMLGWRSAVASVITISTFVATSHSTGLGLGWSGELGRWYDIWGTAYPAGRGLTLTPSAFLGDAMAKVVGLCGIESRIAYQAAAIGSVVCWQSWLSSCSCCYEHSGRWRSPRGVRSPWRSQCRCSIRGISAQPSRCWHFSDCQIGWSASLH